MSDERLRCPHCRAKLVAALVGTVTVFCRRCKREITLTTTTTRAV